MNQTEVARRLGKPQSYVAKYEGGERRLDVVEFLAVCDAIAVDPLRFIRALMRSRTRGRQRDIAAPNRRFCPVR